MTSPVHQVVAHAVARHRLEIGDREHVVAGYVVTLSMVPHLATDGAGTSAGVRPAS